MSPNINYTALFAPCGACGSATRQNKEGQDAMLKKRGIAEVGQSLDIARSCTLCRNFPVQNSSYANAIDDSALGKLGKLR